MVAQFVSVWRRPGHLSRPDRPRRIAPRHAAILTTKSLDQLTDEQRSLFDRLSTSCPALLWMRTLALDFREAMASNLGGQMRCWIATVKQFDIGSRGRF